jgi:NAD-dependent deacetylase
MGKIVVISGAGLSAPSGISTFRDKNGLWENHKISDVAEYSTWRKNFNLVHQFYNERRIQLGTVEPNAGHYFFTNLANKYETTHVTQNIDNLLEKSGHPKTNYPTSPLIHVHGFLTEMKCENCHHVWDIGTTEFKANEQFCPACFITASVKPNVVFFGESAPMYSYMYRAIDSLTKDDIAIICGTMGVVLPVNAILNAVPCKKILNNLEKHSSIVDTGFDLVLYKSVVDAVPEMDEFIKNHFGY